MALNNCETGQPFTIGYLSAGPRVATRLDAEQTAARAHVLGVIGAYRTLGHTVKEYIVGDRVPSYISGSGSERFVTGNPIRTFAVDLTRLALGSFHAYGAWRELGTGVDFVYERLATMQTLGQRFARANIPWILESNTLYFREAKQDRQGIVLQNLARKRELWAYRQSTLIVAVTHNLRELILEAAQVPPDKVVVIPNAVEPDRFDPAAHAPKRLFEAFTIGFVGALYAWQAIDLLLEVLQQLKHEGLTVALVVVGDGQMLEQWRDYARRLGLADRVRFVGRVPWDEIPGYIAGFDLCFSGHKITKAHPLTESPLNGERSKVYMSPLKLYEYMAMAKPVLASDFEDTARVLIEDETGFLFSPENQADLKRAVRKVWNARERLHQVGAAARAEVLAKHSWQQRIKDLLQILEVRGIVSSQSVGT